jgi:hypothetical protein
MPYNLRTFDGRPFTVVNDGVVDRQGTSSLYFIGKDVKDYGTIQNDNFLWLLENFAGTVEPINKVQGQIWFDKGTLRPKVYDGFEWRTFALTSIGTTPAANMNIGELWFDTSREKLFAKGIENFVLIGPESVPGYGKTKFESVKILDTVYQGHACIVIYSDGNIIGAVSNDEFNVLDTEDVFIAGIVRISRGLNLVSGVDIIQDKKFAQQVEDEVITGKWTFNSNDGVYIKSAQLKTANDNLEITGINSFTVTTDSIVPGKSTTLLGTAANKFAKVYVSEINAGSSISEISLIGQFKVNSSSRIFPGNDGLISLGQSNARWSSVFTSALNAGGSSSNGNIIGTWALEGNSKIDASLGILQSKTLTAGSSIDTGLIEGTWQLSENSTIDTGMGRLIATTISAGLSPFGVIEGYWQLSENSTIDTGMGKLIATTISAGPSPNNGIIEGNWTLSAGSKLNATYADIAENYKSDKDYDPGTVVEFGGTSEVTVCKTEASSKVAGVVTTNPAQILNSDLSDSVAIALVGRVPCRVVGEIKKGDLLVASDVPGAAVANNNPKPGTLIGKAMEDYNSFKVGKIEIMVVRG